jgi:hypothetical protein
MRRSASESTFWVVPICGMHVPPLQTSVNPATPIEVGPASVELPAFAKSTWNFQRLTLVDVPSDTK